MGDKDFAPPEPKRQKLDQKDDERPAPSASPVPAGDSTSVALLGQRFIVPPASKAVIEKAISALERPRSRPRADEADLSSLRASDGSTIIHTLAEDGSLPALKRACDRYPNLAEVVDCHGSTPLHAAVGSRNLKALKFLCERYPALVRKGDKAGDTLMHLAAACWGSDTSPYWIEGLHWLLQNHPALTRVPDGCEEPPHFATASLEAVQIILRSQPDVALWTQSDGCTVLHHAVWNDRRDIAAFLADSFPTLVTAKDKSGCTPTHIAVEKNHLALFRMLVARNRSVLFVKDEDDMTPLRDLVWQDRVEFAKCLCEDFPEESKRPNEHGSTLVGEAASWGALGVVQYFSQFHPERMTELTLGGASLLATAACGGHLPVVEFLLQRHPELLLRGGRHLILLPAAARGGVEVVKQLIRHDPSLLSVSNPDGCGPLHYAAREGQLPVVEFLCDSHPELVLQTDNEGRGALFWACWGSVEVLRYLARRYPALVQADGERALAVTCSAQNKVDKLAYLLEDHPSLWESTMMSLCSRRWDGPALPELGPIHYAVILGNAAVVAYLAANFPFYLLVTVHDSSILHLAVRRFHSQVAQVLLRAAPQLLACDGPSPFAFLVDEPELPDRDPLWTELILEGEYIGAILKGDMESVNELWHAGRRPNLATLETALRNTEFDRRRLSELRELFLKHAASHDAALTAQRRMAALEDLLGPPRQSIPPRPNVAREIADVISARLSGSLVDMCVRALRTGLSCRAGSYNSPWAQRAGYRRANSFGSDEAYIRTARALAASHICWQHVSLADRRFTPTPRAFVKLCVG